MWGTPERGAMRRAVAASGSSVAARRMPPKRHKSRYSSTGNNCVEVAGNLPAVVAVRDSTAPGVGAHVVRPDTWHAFVTAVKRNRM